MSRINWPQDVGCCADTQVAGAFGHPSGKLKHCVVPFQGCPVTSFSDNVASAGKQLLHTDIVVEQAEASDKFQRERLLELMWKDLPEMFPQRENNRFRASPTVPGGSTE